MKTLALSTLIILLFVTGCSGTFELGLEPSGASANTSTSTATVTAIPSEDSIPAVTTFPQSTPTVELPSVTSAATIIPGVTGTPAGTAAVQTVQVYLIALEDNGQAGLPVGCGDSTVPVQVQIQPTQGVLKAAMEALLSIKEQTYGLSGLYNALYQSDLQVDRVEIKDGKAEVFLSGSMMLGGVCDNPRVQAQLVQTMLQFPTVTEAEVYINGISLEEALSLK